MLIEERGLTMVKSCSSITSHSRISSSSTKIENGAVWLGFTRPSTFSGVAVEIERLDWSSAEVKMVDWVCLDGPLNFLV
jgi:hypothetical protein